MPGPSPWSLAGEVAYRNGSRTDAFVTRMYRIQNLQPINLEELSMSAATLSNGKPQRKQLSDEIDRLEKQLGDQCNRLDSIVDALAEGLPGAVADACREGARAALKDAIIEIVSNPELRALIAPVQPAPVAS